MRRLKRRRCPSNKLEGMEPSLWLLLTLSLRGILADEWWVQLPSKPVCAISGSSVVLPCSYDYPRSSTGPSQGEGMKQEFAVSSLMWCLEQSRCITERYVFHSDAIFPHPSYHNRVQYLGEPGTTNCSLRISDLRPSDTGTYVFYIVTNHTTQKMPEQRGVQLLVADSPIGVAASASPSTNVTEGQTLRLSCCSPTTSPETLFRWYNGTATTDGQMWEILHVSEADSGRYHCEMRTGESLSNSAPLDINVQYPPRKTTITSSEQQGEGALTLTCSSDANPPVHWFTWYQDAACLPGATASAQAAITSAATVQNTLSSSNITADRDGQHCCVARNKHGSQMFTVTLDGSEEWTDGWMILTGVLIAILLIILAAFFVYITRRNKSSSHQSYVLTDTTVS